MFKDFLYPQFKQYDVKSWRKKNLYVEEVDYALKLALPSLREIYKRNSGKLTMPGAPKFMSVVEFEDMIV